MQKREFEDGTIVTIDFKNKILFISCPEEKSFSISGFLTHSQIDTFVNFGDFSEGKDNDFFQITGENINLIWKNL